MRLLNFLDKKQKMTTFEALYAAHYSFVVRRIAYLISDVHVAEELAQEVFMKLYNNPPTHDNVEAWLNTVSARTAYNHIRDDRAHREKELEHFSPTWEHLPSAEEAAIVHESVLEVREVLSELSVRDRTCLLMKHSGYKYSEIAECLELDAAAVGTIIARAQKKFKVQMETRYEQGGVI